MVSSYPPLLFTILIFLLGSLFFCVSPALGGKTLVGGWTPIKNCSDTKVVDVGKFAVARHNFQAKTWLVFNYVVTGETRSGGGTEYNLTIAAKDGDSDDTLRDYVSIVFDRPFQNFMELVSFRGLV